MNRSPPPAFSVSEEVLQGFTPLLSLAHLDEETASTFPLKIKVQGVSLPNLDAQERAVAGIAGPRDQALFLYVQKAATNCASGSHFRIHSRIAVNGKDDMPGTRVLRKNLFDLRRCLVVHNLHILTRSQPFQHD